MVEGAGGVQRDFGAGDPQLKEGVDVTVAAGKARKQIVYPHPAPWGARCERRRRVIAPLPRRERLWEGGPLRSE